MTDISRRTNLFLTIVCTAALAIGACGDDDGGNGNGVTPDTGSDLPACSINRDGVTFPETLEDGEGNTRAIQVIVEAVDFENDIVVIKNVSDASITFDNTWRVYTQIAPVEINGFVLAAGSRVKVHTTGSGINDADDYYCNLTTAWLEACSGELAIIHNPSPDTSWYNVPNFIEAHLIWGNRYPMTASATWNDEAVSAGAWTTPYNGASSNIDVCWATGQQPTCIEGGGCAANDVGLVATGDVTDPTGWTSVAPEQSSCLEY
ncbi:MAG: hypothetical protein JW797_18500 [Bradymonadales bacterium]|nr:hypothetical protein [Bradymonadales bacterium]